MGLMGLMMKGRQGEVETSGLIDGIVGIDEIEGIDRISEIRFPKSEITF